MEKNIEYVLMNKIFDLDLCGEEMNDRKANQKQCQQVVRNTQQYVHALKQKKLKEDLRAVILNQIEAQGYDGKIAMSQDNLEIIFNKLKNQYAFENEIQTDKSQKDVQKYFD